MLDEENKRFLGPCPLLRLDSGVSIGDVACEVGGLWRSGIEGRGILGWWKDRCLRRDLSFDSEGVVGAELVGGIDGVTFEDFVKDCCETAFLITRNGGCKDLVAGSAVPRWAVSRRLRSEVLGRGM